ncbi:MAG: hypothetical protein DRQ49_19550 [Gammaproteobacteria bacterium]|nr:MAG: hypothetical protein DRQ49_19550 [Gammaproteobacteria bacterium]
MDQTVGFEDYLTLLEENQPENKDEGVLSITDDKGNIITDPKTKQKQSDEAIKVSEGPEDQ